MVMDEGLYGTRTAKGEWTPERRASYGPLFTWPPKPVALMRWFVHSYLLSWNTLFAAVGIALYGFATPSEATTRTLSVGWVAYLFVRNVAIVAVWFGAFHWRLYVRRAQDTRFKYNARWPRESDRFTFGSQKIGRAHV